MGNKLYLTTISLHISAVLYGLLSVGMPMLILALDHGETFHGSMVTALYAMSIFLSAVLVIAIESVVWAINNRKRWGYIAGLVLSGLFLPSLFFVLGLLGFWGLLDKGSRAEFGYKVDA